MIPIEDFKKMLPAEDLNLSEEEILKRHEQITDLAEFLVKICINKKIKQKNDTQRSN